MENAKSVYESFLKGWNSSEVIRCANEPYRSGISCGRRLAKPQYGLNGEYLEGFIVGVTSRWVAMAEVARQCGYDHAEDVARERNWFVDVLADSAERDIDQNYVIADARAAARDT